MSPFKEDMFDFSVTAVAGENDQEFLRFDVVADDSDHYYLKKNKPSSGDCFTNGSSQVYKRIMKEREILEKNLPGNIFVRVYEQRIDLLRAVIVGTPGTPCHDGLFFFDFAFPSDYPFRRPKFCFPSFAAKERVVFITVPDAWWGDKKHKKWNPSKSTVLQVLLKLQSQLPEWILTLQCYPLNEKPFLLGKGASSKNTIVFVASCLRMLLLIRSPPKNFEAFVAEHFRKRGNVVLKACNAYMNGEVRVGNYKEGDDGYVNDVSLPRNNCVIKVRPNAFQASLEKLYPQLFKAFTGSGASVRNLVRHRELDTETTEKVKDGITSKIMGTIKKILGMMKKSNAKA